MERYISASEAAARLCVSKKTLLTWALEGRIRSFKPGRLVVFRESDIESYIESTERGTFPETAER